MYICNCQGVTQNHIAEAIAQGADSFEAVQRALGVSQQCGQCLSLAKNIVDNHLLRDDLFYAA